MPIVGDRMSTLVRRPAVPVLAAAAVVSIQELNPHCGSCSMRELCLSAGLEPEEMRRLDDIISNRKQSGSAKACTGPAILSVRCTPFDWDPSRRYCLPKTAASKSPDTTWLAKSSGWTESATAAMPARRSRSRTARHASSLSTSSTRWLTTCPLLRRNLYRFIGNDVGRDRDMMLLLGSRTAEERLALFLLSLADRHRMRGYSSSEFVLRMTREEIASYLGLKLETVSRLFSRLQAEGLLQVQGRAIKLLDLVALKKLVGRRRRICASGGSSRKRRGRPSGLKKPASIAATARPRARAMNAATPTGHRPCHAYHAGAIELRIAARPARKKSGHTPAFSRPPGQPIK